MIKLAVFDFDGTIADSFEVSLQIAAELLGRPRLSKNEIEILRTLPTKVVMKRLGIRHWQLPRLLFKGRKMMATRISEVTMFAGLGSVFKQLQTAGTKICIMSSNDAQLIDDFLILHQSRNYFDTIIGGVNLFKKAKQLKKIKKTYGVTRHQIVYIGDETRDIAAAKKSGVRSAAVSWGYNSESALKNEAPDILAKTTKQLTKELQIL